MFYTNEELEEYKNELIEEYKNRRNVTYAEANLMMNWLRDTTIDIDTMLDNEEITMWQYDELSSLLDEWILHQNNVLNNVRDKWNHSNEGGIQ